MSIVACSRSMPVCTATSRRCSPTPPRQVDLWGISLYPAESGTEGFLEFDSMINLRPGQGNRSWSVDDLATRERVAAMVARVVAA